MTTATAQEIEEARIEMDRAWDALHAVDRDMTGYEENYHDVWIHAHEAWSDAWVRYHEVAGIPYDLD